MYKINTDNLDPPNFILTNHGHKSPKDIIYNDKICNSKGTFCSIKNIICTPTSIDDKENKTKNKKEDIVVIHTEHTLQIYSPTQYTFLTKFIDPQLPISEQFDQLHSTSNTKWTYSNELKPGHIMAIPINQHQKTPSLPIHRNNIITKHKINNPRIWFLMGYFLHYGIIEDYNYSPTKSKDNKFYVNFTIYDHKEKQFQEYLDDYILSIPTIYSNGLNDVSIYKIEVDEIVFQILLNLMDKKSIPEWVHDAPQYYLYSFIHGFIYNVHNVNSIYNKNSFMYTWELDSACACAELRKLNIEILLSLQLVLFKCDIINLIESDKDSSSVYKMIIQKEKKENSLYPFFKDRFVWIPFIFKNYTSHTKPFTHITHGENSTMILNNLIMKLNTAQAY